MPSPCITFLGPFLLITFLQLSFIFANTASIPIKTRFFCFYEFPHLHKCKMGREIFPAALAFLVSTY